MIKIKSFILDETNWLEVTWVNESDEQIHCESFSGHREHIAMLRAKALEFGTELDEALISECVANFKYPTEAEIALETLRAKVAEAKQFLNATQFKFGDDYDQKDTPEWLELKAKRQELREFIRANNG